MAQFTVFCFADDVAPPPHPPSSAVLPHCVREDFLGGVSEGRVYAKGIYTLQGHPGHKGYPSSSAKASRHLSWVAAI